MQYVIIAIVSYLSFNVAIWMATNEGGLMALALANTLGGVATAIFFRAQVQEGPKPNFLKALLGAGGILAIVVGLMGAHSLIPPSLAVEAVYNLFAVASWPMFVILFGIWPLTFTERPNRFNLMCHGLMFVLVVGRFLTYPDEFVLTPESIGWVLLAVGGYALFNISIKISKGHRTTNVTMNVVAGIGLFALAMLLGEDWLSLKGLFAGTLGGISIFGIVWSLGKSYAYFGSRDQASLVAPLVYDGILVAAPLLVLVTGESLNMAALPLALGMLGVTAIRYRWGK